MNTYHRLICIVPMTGSGTMDDPKRPLYAPARPLARAGFASAAAAPSCNGIIAFTHVPSDNGLLAIVEFVAADRSAFNPILADKAVLSFEKSKVSAAAIEAEIKKVKKNFTLQGFGMAIR